LAHGSVLSETTLHHLPLLNALDHFEQIEHFPLTHATISVLVTLLSSLENLLLVVGRSHAHGKAQISVGHEELLAFKLSRMVSVISLEDHLNILLKSLVVVLLPSSGVVDLLESLHLVVVLVTVSPSVEAVSMMTVMVSVMSVT